MITGAAPAYVERVHVFRLPTGGRVRLAFRTEPGTDLVAVHQADASRHRVGEVSGLGTSGRPRLVFARGYAAVLSCRANHIRRLAGALHRFTGDRERCSFLPLLPGPDSVWFTVRGIGEVAFTANVPAGWVTLYLASEDGPVYVGQVARIGEGVRVVLRLGQAGLGVDGATGDLLVSAAVHVWDRAATARTGRERAA